MIHTLKDLNITLDTILQPLLTNEDWDKYTSNNPIFPAPRQVKFEPPANIPRLQKGFMLAEHVECYQRGYSPPGLFEEYIEVMSNAFKHPADSSLRGIDQMTWDFLVVIVAHDRNVAAGCVVELRRQIDPHTNAYLYISSLCTNPKFRSRGIAHQLVHSVYTLGAILLEQNWTGTWKSAIPEKQLYVGLNVRKTPGSDVYDRLIKLYTQCGLRPRWKGMPAFDFESFTTCSIYGWQIDREWGTTALWQSISPKVIYQDKYVEILSPTCSGEEWETMYHQFPVDQMDKVKAKGIVHSKHLCLHRHAAYTTDDIRFTKTRENMNGLFCIRARSANPTISLRVSVPVFFAEKIV